MDVTGSVAWRYRAATAESGATFKLKKCDRVVSPPGGCSFFVGERTEVSLSAASDGRFSLSIAAGLKSFLMDNGFCSTRSVRKRPLRPVACCVTAGGWAGGSVLEAKEEKGTASLFA